MQTRCFCLLTCKHLWKSESPWTCAASMSSHGSLPTEDGILSYSKPLVLDLLYGDHHFPTNNTRHSSQRCGHERSHQCVWEGWTLATWHWNSPLKSIRMWPYGMYPNLFRQFDLLKPKAKCSSNTHTSVKINLFDTRIFLKLKSLLAESRSSPPRELVMHSLTKWWFCVLCRPKKMLIFEPFLLHIP